MAACIMDMIGPCHPPANLEGSASSFHSGASEHHTSSSSAAPIEENSTPELIPTQVMNFPAELIIGDPGPRPEAEQAATEKEAFEARAKAGEFGHIWKYWFENLDRIREQTAEKGRQQARELMDHHYYDTPEEARYERDVAQDELDTLDDMEGFHNLNPLWDPVTKVLRADATIRLRQAQYDLSDNPTDRAQLKLAMGGAAIRPIAEQVSVSAVPVPEAAGQVIKGLGNAARRVATPVARVLKVQSLIEKSGLRQLISQAKFQPLTKDSNAFWGTKRGQSLIRNKNAGVIGEELTAELTGLRFTEAEFKSRLGSGTWKTDFYDKEAGLIGQVKNKAEGQALDRKEIRQITNTVLEARAQTTEDGEAFNAFLFLSEGTPVPPELQTFIDCNWLVLFRF